MAPSPAALREIRGTRLGLLRLDLMSWLLRRLFSLVFSLGVFEAFGVFVFCLEDLRIVSSFLS